MTQLSRSTPDAEDHGAETGYLARVAARDRKKRRKYNIIAVAVTSCIVAAVFFWLWAFRLYSVSSNSMAPTLRGTYGNRDRLLCWNLAYRFREPRRWEIITFDTPPSAVGKEMLPGLPYSRETGRTVKRLVGLPGERLALAGGDVWTRPLDGDQPFRRLIKPDAVQKGMWIRVYDEDFADAGMDEFLYWWPREGEGSTAITENTLFLSPDEGEGMALRYRPVTRVGDGSSLMELPGVPDRYVLIQDIYFLCRNIECAAEFQVEIDTAKVQGRCPVCGWLNLEDRVRFYGLRSGLPEIGPYSTGTLGTLQGDTQHTRTNNYHFVQDLRLTVEVRPLASNTRFGIELSGGDHKTVAVFGDGAAAVDGEAVDLGAHSLKVGEWTRVEVYSLDGAIRVFVGPERTPVFDRVLWPEERQDRQFLGSHNGVAMTVSGGDVSVRNIALDRDIYYYSGRDQGWGGHLAAMTREGEIDVGENEFFPLGDNTTVSLDGRSWGAVDKEYLRGSVLMIVQPRERAGIIATPP